MVQVLVFAVFIGIFGLAMVGAVRRTARGRENLRRLGSTMNLPVIEPEKKGIFHTGKVSLEGAYRGRPLRVYSYTRGSGKNRTHWCGARFGVENGRKLSLSISSENVFTRIGERLGFSQVNVGDEDFDRKFHVKSSDADFLRAALIPEVRSRFVEAWGRGARGKVTVDESGVRYDERGTFGDAGICARFPAVSDLLCDIAEIVEAHSRMSG